MSSAYHPQTDGQSERANRTVEDMLRPYLNHHKTDWDQHLAAVEFAYNSSTHVGTGFSPFYLNYGHHPRTPEALLQPPSTLVPSPAADAFVTTMRSNIDIAKAALQRAVDKQKQQADKHRRHLEFNVGDKVLLSTATLNLKTPSNSAKLQPRYVGPFKVLTKVSPVAYKLDLPTTMRITPTFHISKLRPYLTTSSFPDRHVDLQPLPQLENGEEYFTIEAILGRRWNDSQHAFQYLVKWKGYDDSFNSWEWGPALAEQEDVAAMIRDYTARYHVPPDKPVDDDPACQICASRASHPPMLLCDKSSPRSPGHLGLLGKALLKGAVLALKGKLAARKLRDATARGLAIAGQWVGGEPSASSPSLDPMDAEAAAPSAPCRTEVTGPGAVAPLPAQELCPSTGLGTRLGTVRVGPGLAQPHKLQALLDWAADSPAQVVFLQECHRAESVWQWAEAQSGAKPAWRGQWFHTPGTGSSQGCLVVVKPSTILQVCTQVQLQAEGAQGRVLRIDGELAGRPVSLVCVYAPAQQAERPAFYAECLPACLPPAADRRLLLMGGDFNCILAPMERVCIPHGSQHGEAWVGSRGQGAEQLRQLVGERGLVDPWHHLHPSKRDLTHFSERWQTGARLDRWYISEELVQWQMDSAIQGVLPVPTDHRPVSVAVYPPDLPLTVPAPWQLHPAHLDNPDLLDCLKDFLQAEALYHEAASQLGLPRDGHRARWARLKQGLAMRAQHFLRAQRRAQRDLQQRREKAVAVARAHLVRQLVQVEREGEAEVQAAQHLGEAAALAGVGAREQGAQQSLLASAVLDQYYGDRSSYFYHRDQPAHTPTLISSLQLPGQPGQPADLTTPAGVKAACRAFQQHYSAAGPTGVYAAKPVDTAARATLLGSLTSHLTPTQARAAEGPDGSPMLSEEELGRALQGCAHSKAPGLDGLPMEVYDRLWVELGRPLRAMLREALADTADPAPLAEFLTGIITLVPKAGKPRDQVAGYRPITLLNCDVRLVARAVEDRLQLPLDLLVSPSQSAFILGRDISDSVQFHLGLLEYLQQRGSPAWLLLLDLAGPHDNVSWGLLQDTMEAMGFCREGHVRWAQLLHRGATSQVLVNGHLTDSFPLASGLLQGSGASPLYWCIVLQPLVSYLSSLQLAGRISTPTIPSSPLAMHKAALTPALPSKEYTDDHTIVVLDRVRDGKVVVEALGLFRAAGGPALSGPALRKRPCAALEALRCARAQPCRAPSQSPDWVTRRARAKRGRGGEEGGVTGGKGAGRGSEAAFGGAAAAMMAASLPWRPQGLNLLGRVQVAQQCLASKSIYLMAFVPPSAPLAQATALAVNRFVAASDLPQERIPNSSRLYPSKAICVLPRGEGGVGLPDLGVTSTAMLAKMLAQLWSPRVRPWQPLTHSLLADPSHGLSTPRLQAHVAALAELKLFRAVPPASQSFFSVLAEPLWYNAQEEWLMGPWAHLQLDPQVWGMGTTTLLDFSVKHARVRLHQLQRVSADPLYPPSGGLWSALWGVRPPRAAGEPEVAAVADGVLRELELKWEASAQQVAGQGAAGEREQQGRDVEERLPEEVQGSQPPRWLDTSARAHQRPSPQMRAAQQAERQLEAQQRRGGRQPLAQPAPRADTVDQLAVGVQAGQPCAQVWKKLLDPILRREHVIVAWRVLHASLMVGALWGHILKGTAATGSSACRFCQPGHLETLTHAFLTCPAVVPAWEWVLDVYGRLTGTRPPSGDAMLLLSGRPTRGEAPPFQPPDSQPFGSPSLDPMDAEAAAPTAPCRTGVTGPGADAPLPAQELGPSTGRGSRFGSVRGGSGELQGSQPPRWFDTAATTPPRFSLDDRRAGREERQRAAQCRLRRGNTQPANQPVRGGPRRRRFGNPSSGSSSGEWEAQRTGHQQEAQPRPWQAGGQRAAQLGHGSPHVRRYGLLSPCASLATSLGASCDSPVVESAGPRDGRLRVPKRQQPEQAAQLGPRGGKPGLARQRPGVAARFLAVTLNVQGLAQPHKLQALLDWAADSPAQVAFLQECHRAESVWQWAEAQSGAKPAWRGQWFHTPGTGSSQGCLVVVKPSTILQVCTQVQLQAEGAQGRVLRIGGELAGRPVSLVCVYAPAQQAERPAFYAECLPACLPPAADRRLLLMGGDFNCILAPMERVGIPQGSQHGEAWVGSRGQGAEQLRQLVGERGLVDPWRHLHPSKRDLTHFSERWQTGARLDRWYISEELVQWQMDSAIQGVLPVPTDHRPVSVAVCPPDLPLTVPAPWQLHPAHLDNPDLLDCLKDFLQAEALYHEAASQLGLPRDGHRARWARLKQGLAMRAQHFLRAQRRAQRDLQQRREKAVAVAMAHLVRQLVQVEREGEAEVQAAQHLGEAAALAGVGAREQGAQQSPLASAVLDQYYGDRSSFYFYHRDQPAHTPTLISSLQLPGQPGQPADLTTPAGVKAACRAFQQHYSAAGPTGVYAAKPVDTAARATLLGSLTSHLTPTQARAAEGPDGSPMLSEEELVRALRGCAHSKAPGLDGLPMEVYDRLWVELGRPLRAMLRDALADTADPAPLAEFLTGIITLVPKAGKPRDQVAGYRPITLLNCDVRLVARAMEDRLQLPLDLLVSPSQSAFIPGRDISDSVQFHLGPLEYLQQRGSPAWLLLLDLAGPHDNVSWGLLQDTMEAMGFCREGHVRWAQLLHRGATSQVLVNGHLTDSFPLASGLLQGSGASPLYWCIVLQPLVSYLSSLQLAGRISTPTIPSSPLAMHRAALTPALPSKENAGDHTIVVLDRVRDGKVVVEALGLFRAAGGPALSVSKSSAMPCAQPEPWLGNQEGSGQEGAGRGGRGGDWGEGGGQGQVGEQGLGGGLGEGGGLGQQQGGREQGGEQEPELVIPAVRAGVPVRHLGVPLGAASYAATSEAAFGGAAAAMMAASLPWRPQGLNLLGRVQVAQQCLASKSIYPMAFVQPSAPLAQAMALAVNRFERSPNSSRLYPSKAICVLPRGEGGVGLPDLGVTSTAMLAKMLAQLWSPRVRPLQPLTHSLLADPSHGLSTWVITDPTAPPSRGISPRLQAHVAALAELKLFRAVPPASQSFFSVLAEPLWYNAQVRMNPAAREAAAEQGWTHVRHVREALHSPQLEGEARWAADLVRACLPEPWQGMVDRMQPPQPEWECLRIGLGVGFVMRRTPLLQPSHWVGPNGRLYPLDPTGQGPLGAFWAEEGAAWEPASVTRLNKPSYRLTPEERAIHLRPLPAQRHAAQEQAQGQEQGRARAVGRGGGGQGGGAGAGGEGVEEVEGEEWLMGPWAHLQLDPQVWGMGTTTLLDFSVKHARVRLHQLQRVSADPLYPPSGGLWPALWGVRPPRAAGEPEVAAVADGVLRELELKWEASAQQVAGQVAAGEREQQGRDVEERLPEEAGQPCAQVWKKLLDPILRREHVIVAWRVLHASLMVGALWGHILKGTAATGSSACRFCQPGHLETLTHAFLTCPAVVPAWEWVLDVYGRLTGTRPPSGDAMLLLKQLFIDIPCKTQVRVTALPDSCGFSPLHFGALNREQTTFTTETRDLMEELSPIAYQVSELMRQVGELTLLTGSLRQQFEHFVTTQPVATPASTPLEPSGQSAPPAPPAATSVPLPFRPPPPPSFCGTPNADAGQWLWRIDNHFDLFAMPAQQRLLAVASYLDGAALTWYRSLLSSQALSSWDSFKASFTRQFTPVNQQRHAMDQLAACHQITSARQYITEFSNLCLLISDLSPAEKLDRFLRGLKPAVRRELELREPTSFEEAAAMADRVDAITFGSRPRLLKLPEPEPVAAMELDALQVSKGPRLSAAERQQLRDLGACFYCRKPGHLMKDCPNKPPRPKDVGGVREAARR
ncbi:hypothetical protein QJQ45_004586 [Haematococcus lacustris]|nr:hypothetical protein QJQ45_004586 [Haematococcus lacustris]